MTCFPCILTSWRTAWHYDIVFWCHWKFLAIVCSWYIWILMFCVALLCFEKDSWFGHRSEPCNRLKCPRLDCHLHVNWPYKGYNNTIQDYFVTVINHVIALEDGQYILGHLGLLHRYAFWNGSHLWYPRLSYSMGKLCWIHIGVISLCESVQLLTPPPLRPPPLQWGGGGLATKNIRRDNTSIIFVSMISFILSNIGFMKTSDEKSMNFQSINQSIYFLPWNCFLFYIFTSIFTWKSCWDKWYPIPSSADLSSSCDKTPSPLRSNWSNTDLNFWSSSSDSSILFWNIKLWMNLLLLHKGNQICYHNSIQLAIY